MGTGLSFVTEIPEQPKDFAQATVKLVDLFLTEYRAISSGGVVYTVDHGVSSTKYRLSGAWDVLLWSHEDPGAFLPRLPVDKCAMDFRVQAMRAGVPPVTSDLKIV